MKVSKFIAILLVGGGGLGFLPIALAKDTKQVAAAEKPATAPKTVKCDCICPASDTKPDVVAKETPEDTASSADDQAGLKLREPPPPPKLAPFSWESGKKSESSPYVLGGAVMMAGYDTGYYLGWGKKLGPMRNYMDVDWSGDLLIEGSYETGSKSFSYPVFNGFSLSTASGKVTYTQIGVTGLYRQKVDPSSKWSYTVAAGAGKQDVKADYAGYSGNATSGIKLVAAVGLRYVYSPLMDLDMRYYASGFEGYRLGLTYRY